MIYNRTEHSRDFFICFMIKNLIISPCIRLNLFSKRGKVVSAVLCYLIKHTKINQSQSLLQLFKKIDWLTRQQLSIEHYYTACKCCLSIFTKIKLNWCFLSLFYFLILFSAFVTNVMSFIEAYARLRICLFRCMFCLNQAKLVILVQFYYFCY